VEASATTWPAASSARSSAVVHGPVRPATVLAAFPSALYLQVGGHADVLPVVTRHGLRLPTALALATPLPTVGWGVQPGGRVAVGGGEVRLPLVTIRAVRTWQPHVVQRAAGAPRAARLSTLSLPWRSPARSVTELLLGQEPNAETLAHRVAALVGTGPGLTPSGDDVLCGVLLGLRLHPHASDELVAALWQAVRPRLTSTTSLSAALLTEAAEGYAAEPVLRLVERLAVPADPVARPADLPGAGIAEALAEVLAIGHSSGADLLGGLAGCLEALDAPTGSTTLPRQITLSTLTATPGSLP
jgi:hypothetical protein